MISVITPAVAGTSHARLASRLLAGTALVLLLSAGQALADGGRGGDRSGNPGSGGAGGIDNPTGAGGAGVRGQVSPGGNAGGGGGGAGAVTGGAGGLAGFGSLSEGRGGDGGVHGSVGASLPTGSSSGSNGGDGTSGGLYSGGGGGAGGYGAVVTGAGTTGTVSGTITGGNGGHGGGSFYEVGGSGGSGGIGLLFTDGSAAQTLTIGGTVLGGNGGNGGSHVADAGGAGAGGAGGAGLVFTSGGATTTLIVNGAVSGGDGRRGGTNLPASFCCAPGPGENALGVAAAGGEGIIGADLSITNNGTIIGGLSGDGSVRAAAIHFTGGSNKLTMGSPIATIFGGIVIDTGTLTFAQTIDATISSVVSGGGIVVKTGEGTLTLTGENTYTGGTRIAEGAISISAEGNLGATSGALELDGGMLQVTGTTLTGLTRTIYLGSNGGGFDIADAANTFTVTQSFSGSGKFTKAGDGTLVLSGTNSYTGTTTVSNGILRAGQANAFSPGSAVTIMSGATLDLAGFDQTIGSLAGPGAVTLGSATLTAGGNNTSTTFLGTISGTGGLTKTGSGTLTLTGTNTYSGATTVSAGTLYIGGSGAMSAASDYTVASGALLQVNDTLGTVTAGSIAGDGQLRIESGSTLETGATNASTTFSGMIWDSGSLRKVGTGTLTLTQENTYSGGTTIAGGKISISKDVNLGSPSGALMLDGGVLQVTGTALHELTRNIILGSNGGGFDIVEAGNSFIVSQSLSGTGSLSKTGAGTLVLKGASSYSGTTTVSEGTLRAGAADAFSANSTFTVGTGTTLDLAGLNQTIGSLAGTGTVTLGSGTLTAGANNSSTTFSGKITGTGGVTKTGTGTLTLTGSNTYTGATKVSGGKLVVNGSLASSVTLDGGTLGGSGTIGGVSVASGATVAPGNSIGTLTVSGNVAFASGSTYQVEVNAAGQSDRIVASGSATITGGTVQVLAENGNYAAATSYTILTASGGVTGSFSSVTSNLAFLTPSLSYGSQNVTLTMTRNDTGFGPDGGGTSGGGASGTYIAQTRNQGFIAIAAERLGVGNPVYDALISATAAEARAGFDLLSGEAHAQAVSVMIDESRLVRETILGHLRGPLLTAPGQQVAGAFTADLPGRKGAIVMPAPVPQPRYALWGTAFGSTGNTDADGNAASLSRRSGGALLGADVMLYDAPGSSLKVGVAGGYSQSRFDLDARLSSGKLESGHAALYAGTRFGNLRFDAGAAYTWSESDIRRQVQIRGFGDLLRLQRPGSVTQGFAELGYAFAFQGIALEPFAQLALIRVSTDAGTERGGAAALRVLSSDQTLGFTTLGLRAEAQLGAMPLFARAMLGWRHGFGDLTPQARTAFVAGTTPAAVFAAPIDREALVAEAGLDWRISQATALGLTYSAAIGERSRDHALKGRVEMRF
ncbi:autotransporter domain-containing protein [Bosea sp. (in: a-proteobacteria)]|jgi:outer membrane autotransporter protein|uniref:autotransporter domain-containing protein n=1 Tax=Bosea sp. (in: a-proteobacteria) TaxID=1871050 RepID=UPI002DDC9AA4|nr:autotransporter domain-containing protein [Bosea sp. (in: a-proteobacteria)]HEV2513539.1 autotransporter domain-containing protein [Bosea sp. (in: a-proteobacteria)]